MGNPKSTIDRYNSKVRYDFNESNPFTYKFYMHSPGQMSSPIYVVLTAAKKHEMSYNQTIQKDERRPFLDIRSDSAKNIIRFLVELDNRDSRRVSKRDVTKLWASLGAYSTEGRDAYIPALKNVAEMGGIREDKFNEIIGGEENEEETDNDEEEDEN